MELLKSSRTVDLIGVIAFLILGALGYWVTSDPVRLLVPEHPMLSIHDWTDSDSGHEARISKSRNWNEERILVVRLESKRDSARIVQTAAWYSDSTEASYMWERTQFKYKWDLISEKYISNDSPASRLYCRDLSPTFTTSCYYYAYRGHWFTEVHLSSSTVEYLSLSEVEMITQRVDELLMSIPEE